MLYRVKQFISAIIAKISEEDEKLIETYLGSYELSLFRELKVYEQKHCIQVALGIMKDYPSDDKEELIRVALLHDIGKIKYPLNPIEKSIIVLLDKFTKGKIKKMKRLKVVKCYYEHPEIGYNMLNERGGYTKEFLELVRYHHDKEIQGKDGMQIGSQLRILQICDDRA